jgi:hypothetical protein
LEETLKGSGGKTTGYWEREKCAWIKASVGVIVVGVIVVDKVHLPFSSKYFL